MTAVLPLGAASEPIFRVLTWNVWFSPLCYTARMNYIIQTTLDTDPDVACFQEVLPNFHSMLVANSALRERYSISPKDPYSPYFTCILAKKRLNARYFKTDFPSRMGRNLITAVCDVRHYTNSSDAGEETNNRGEHSRIAVGTVHLESLANHPTREEQLRISHNALSCAMQSTLFNPDGADAVPPTETVGEPECDIAFLVGDFNFCSYRNYDQRDVHHSVGRVLEFPDPAAAASIASANRVSDRVPSVKLENSSLDRYLPGFIDAWALKQQCIVAPPGLTISSAEPAVIAASSDGYTVAGFREEGEGITHQHQHHHHHRFPIPCRYPAEENEAEDAFMGLTFDSARNRVITQFERMRYDRIMISALKPAPSSTSTPTPTLDPALGPVPGVNDEMSSPNTTADGDVKSSMEGVGVGVHLPQWELVDIVRLGMEPIGEQSDLEPQPRSSTTAPTATSAAPAPPPPPPAPTRPRKASRAGRAIAAVGGLAGAYGADEPSPQRGVRGGGSSGWFGSGGGLFGAFGAISSPPPASITAAYPGQDPASASTSASAPTQVSPQVDMNKESCGVGIGGDSIAALRTPPPPKKLVWPSDHFGLLCTIKLGSKSSHEQGQGEGQKDGRRQGISLNARRDTIELVPVHIAEQQQEQQAVAARLSDTSNSTCRNKGAMHYLQSSLKGFIGSSSSGKGTQTPSPSPNAEHRLTTTSPDSAANYHGSEKMTVEESTVTAAAASVTTDGTVATSFAGTAAVVGLPPSAPMVRSVGLPSVPRLRHVAEGTVVTHWDGSRVREFYDPVTGDVVRTVQLSSVSTLCGQCGKDMGFQFAPRRSGNHGNGDGGGGGGVLCDSCKIGSK